MVIDTSALAAVLFDEPERADFVARIAADGRRLISAATLVSDEPLLFKGDDFSKTDVAYVD